MFKKEKNDKEKVDVKKMEEDIRAKIKAEDKSGTSDESPKERFLVVDKIPTQEVRQVKGEDGTLLNLITIEEALTELMN